MSVGNRNRPLYHGRMKSSLPSRHEGTRMPTGEPPATRSTLIGALCEGLRWEEFVAIYGPLIVVRARREFGLQECDAENVCQEVLIRVWKGIAGYDPARGRFRAWLYACTKNVVADLRPFVLLHELAEIAPDGDTDGMSGARIEVSGGLGLEGVSIVTESVSGDGAAGIIRGLRL